MEPYYYYYNDQITVIIMIIMITLCRPSCVCVSVSSSRTHTRFLLQEKGSDAHFKEERKETAADGRQPADGFWGTEKKKTLRDLHKPPSWKEKRRIGTLEDKNKRKPILLQRSRALNLATLKENVLKLWVRPLNLQTDNFRLTE